jgi:hypothetical protein
MLHGVLNSSHARPIFVESSQVDATKYEDTDLPKKQSNESFSKITID